MICSGPAFERICMVAKPCMWDFIEKLVGQFWVQEQFEILDPFLNQFADEIGFTRCMYQGKHLNQM